jgi:hypothetical protein
MNIFAWEQPFNAVLHLMYSIFNHSEKHKEMKQLRIFAILMSVILMISCNKEQATGTGDAIIVAKQSGTSVVYGISLYAYTLSSFSSVTASSAASPEKKYTLKSNHGYTTSFYYETPESEFTTTKPEAGAYNFSAVFENGITQNFQNTLTDKVLPIPNVTKCEYNTTDQKLEVGWNALADANSYSVSMFDGTTLVFGSIELAKTVLAYPVKYTTTGGGWTVGFTPVSGKTYNVRVFAYLYEPRGGAYNVQAVSIAEKTVVWGN